MEHNPLHLENSEKYFCIALYVPFFTLETPYIVNSGLTIHGNVGEWVGDHWKEWLGPLQLESLHEANALFVAHGPSEKPEIVDAEYKPLEICADRFFSSMLFTGATVSSLPFLIKGFHLGGRTEVKWFMKGPSYVNSRSEQKLFTLVDEYRIQEAINVFNGQTSLFSRTGEFNRLKRGIRSTLSALRQPIVDERSFYFVRALEALHASVRGEGRGDFISKCMLLSGPGPEYEELFGDLYDTRNNFVHVNEFDQLLKGNESLSTVDERLRQQAFDAELIVLEAYRRILSDSDLVENFSHDIASRSHWRTAWSSPVTPEAIRVQRKTEMETRRSSL